MNELQSVSVRGVTPICEDGSDNDQGVVGKDWKRTKSARKPLVPSSRLRAMLYCEAIPESFSVAGWSFQSMVEVVAKPDVFADDFGFEAVLDEAVVFEELQMRGEKARP